MAREAVSRIAPTMPGQRRRQDHLADRLRARRTEAERTVAHGARHRGDDVVGERGDHRDQHDAHDEAGGEDALRLNERRAAVERRAEIAQEGSERDQREDAVDDGRDAGQQFKRRLDHRAHARRGVFGHVDRRHQADRHGDQHRDQRDVERAGKQRDQAELAFGGAGAGGGEARIPDGAEEEAGGRNAVEEVDRLEQHRQHDADGREDGDGRGAEQPPQHQPFDAVAGPRPRLSPGVRRARRRRSPAASARTPPIMPSRSCSVFASTATGIM